MRRRIHWETTSGHYKAIRDSCTKEEERKSHSFFFRHYALSCSQYICNSHSNLDPTDPLLFTRNRHITSVCQHAYLYPQDLSLHPYRSSGSKLIQWWVSARCAFHVSLAPSQIILIQQLIKSQAKITCLKPIYPASSPSSSRAILAHLVETQAELCRLRARGN